MKYLLLPVTLTLWFFLIYFGLTFSLIGIAYIHSMSWMWFILVYVLVMGMLSLIANTLPLVVGVRIIERLYKLNWVAVILHTIVGGLGLFCAIAGIIDQ